MIRINSFIAIGISLLAGCKKDKVPVFPVPEPTKAELISGNYKVYDTMGVYLYDMKLTYYADLSVSVVPDDSIRFENFDGEFTFVEKQSFASNAPKTQIYIGYHYTLYDSQEKRWKLSGHYDPVYNNVWNNDTIKMHFRKTNINYWLQDLTPYYECYCKQIAVKQH